MILIKSVVINNENKYYYNIFLGKSSYKDKSNKQHFKMNVCIWWMLYYDRIGVSEGIDVNKISDSKEVMFVTIGIS